jgi:HSP20 family molecular chaperone IbpA
MTDFRRINFKDLECVLDTFLREDFYYQHSAKPCTIVKGEDGIQVLCYNILGIRREDLKIKFTTENGRKFLKIEGETKNSFGLRFTTKNKFPVAKEVDEDKVTAKIEDGLLYLKLPLKKEYEGKEVDIIID